MFEFRKIEAHELKTISELRWLFQCEESECQNNFNKTEFIDNCTKILQTASMQDIYTHFGAFIDNDLIAITSLCVINKIPRPSKIIDPIGYLTNVFTLKQYRNQNIGTKLIKFIHNWAIAKDLELIIVWPSDESLNFYQRLGYNSQGQPLIYKLRDY